MAKTATEERHDSQDKPTRSASDKGTAAEAQAGAPAISTVKKDLYEVGEIPPPRARAK